MPSQAEAARPRDATPPPGTRLVIVAVDFLEHWGTRNERGDRLTFEWGEPDEHGWYTPTITEHYDDNLVRSRDAELRAAMEGLAGMDDQDYGLGNPAFIERSAVLRLLAAEDET